MVMARLCWHLLAAFVLILFAAVLRAQESGMLTPVLKPEFEPNYSAPPWITPPHPLPTESTLSYSPGINPPIHGPFSFPQMVQLAGMIFSGQVTAVGHGNGPGPAATTVTFQVQQAIHGVAAGETLTIREWAGLWSTGERYRVGERVFLFLYPPSKLGLTSPVAGNIGRFAVNSTGMIGLTPQHVAAFLPDPVLGGGRTFVPFKDFALAVQRAGGRE
jgi:hypothetical protein